MAIYNYTCINERCGRTTQQLLVNKEDTMRCPFCGSTANRDIPSGGYTQVMEVRDKNRGKQVKKGVEKQLKQRMTDHHDKYELAEKIDRHGMDTAKKFGWDKKAKKT